MSVYLKKRHIRKILVVVAVALVFLALLKLVSWWDSKQGAVDTDSIPTTAPPADTQTKTPESSDPAPPEEEEAPSGSDQTAQPVQTEYERRTDELIAQAYALRDGYVSTLETMYVEAEAALTDLVKQEDNAEAIASLASSYLARASELEVQCDEQIDGIVAEMETLIRDNHGDETLIDTLIETYANEKATKKAWYIQRLEEKGLISQ